MRSRVSCVSGWLRLATTRRRSTSSIRSEARWENRLECGHDSRTCSIGTNPVECGLLRGDDGVEVDAFLYPEELVDELCDAGRLQRN